MPQTPPIKVPIVGVDKYSKSLKKLSASVKRIGRGIQTAGRGMTTSLTLPIIGFGVMAGRSAIEFDDTMRGVQAKASETGVSIDQLRQKAKDLGRDTRYKASEAAAGMEKLAMAGWDTGQIFDGIDGILNLAAASSSDLAQSADLTAAIMGAFNKEASESARISDIVAATLTGANVDMETYADSMKYAGAVAETYGASLEDTSAAIGFMGNIGIKGSQAGTTFRKMLLNLATASGKSAKTLEELGIKVGDGEGGVRNFVEILSEMGNKFETLGTREQLRAMDAIFGQRAITGAAAMSGNLAKTGSEFKKLAGALNSVKPGKAKEMAAIMEGGAGGAWRRTVSAFEGLQLAIADSGLLDQLAKFLEGIADSLREMAKTDPQFMQKVAKGLLALAAVGPALTIVGKLVTGVGALIGMAPGLATFAAAIGPQAPIIAGIAALGGALYYFRDEMKPTIEMAKTQFIGILDQIKESASGSSGSVGGLKDSISELGEAFKPLVAEAQPFTELLVEIAGSLLKEKIEQWSDTLNIVTRVVKTLVIAFRKFFSFVSEQWDKIIAKVEELLSKIPGVGKAISFVKDLLPDDAGGVRGAASKAEDLEDQGRAGLFGAWDTLDNWLSGGGDDVKSVENKLTQKTEGSVDVKVSAEPGAKVASVKTSGNVKAQSEDFFGMNLQGDFL